MLVHICCSVDSHYFIEELRKEYPKEKICKENVIELKDRVFRKMNSRSETDLSYNQTKDDSLAQEI